MIMSNKIPKTSRLFVQLEDKRYPRKVDEQGRILVPFIWKEVEEINFGSLANPNKSILSFKIVPVRTETGEFA